MISNCLTADSSLLVSCKEKIEDSLGLDRASLAFRTRQAGLAALSLVTLLGVRQAIQSSFLNTSAIAVPLCVAPFALLFFSLSMSEGANPKNREETGTISPV